MAVGLLTGCAQLLADNGMTYSDSIQLLLEQAKTMLDTENEGAAAVVGSAIALLETGSADAATIIILLNTAIDLCG